MLLCDHGQLRCLSLGGLQVVAVLAHELGERRQSEPSTNLFVILYVMLRLAPIKFTSQICRNLDGFSIFSFPKYVLALHFSTAI